MKKSEYSDLYGDYSSFSNELDELSDAERGGRRMRKTTRKSAGCSGRIALALAPYGIWARAVRACSADLCRLLCLYGQRASASPRRTSPAFSPPPSSIVQDDGSTAEVRTYLLIFWRSLKLAVISTADLPAAGLSHRLYHGPGRSPRSQKTMMTLIMIPMWMNFLIRTYAWMTILQDTGIINGLLSALHLAGVHIIGTEAAVVIGMVYDYFPYMILPIYSIMAKMDGKLHGGRPGPGLQQPRRAARGSSGP